jgi:hypothetical protein
MDAETAPDQFTPRLRFYAAGDFATYWRRPNRQQDRGGCQVGREGEAALRRHDRGVLQDDGPAPTDLRYRSTRHDSCRGASPLPVTCVIPPLLTQTVDLAARTAVCLRKRSSAADREDRATSPTEKRPASRVVGTGRPCPGSRVLYIPSSAMASSAVTASPARGAEGGPARPCGAEVSQPISSRPRNV